jgi:hypothetical protein
MPMQRWIAKAAGGTSHRLKPGRAIIRSRSSSRGLEATPLLAVLADAIDSFLPIGRPALLIRP